MFDLKKLESPIILFSLWENRGTGRLVKFLKATLHDIGDGAGIWSESDFWVQWIFYYIINV